jgi:hypothetical protein
VGRLLEPRFFDRALGTVQEYNEKVQYIHLNPVRAGLARVVRATLLLRVTSSPKCGKKKVKGREEDGNPRLVPMPRGREYPRQGERRLGV